MRTSTQSINPFYEARQRRVAPARAERPAQPVYARLPQAPITGTRAAPDIALSLSTRPGSMETGAGLGTAGATSSKIC